MNTDVFLFQFAEKIEDDLCQQNSEKENESEDKLSGVYLRKGATRKTAVSRETTDDN